MFSYHELVMKYGPSVAYQCLTEIERATHIPSWTVSGIDPETRLANAIHEQDATANDNKHLN